MKKSRYGFPLSPEVKGVYLYGIKYYGLGPTKNYETVVLEFKRGSKGLVDVTYFHEELKYPSYEDYVRDIAAKKMKLERLGLVYLSREEMARINSISEGLDDYVENLRNSLKKKNFKTKKLVIKTVRNRKGYICLPRFGDYVRLEGKDDKVFQYDDYEKGNIEKFKN